MSYGRDWSVTVAITASRWSPDTQAAHTAWLETYDGMQGDIICLTMAVIW